MKWSSADASAGRPAKNQRSGCVPAIVGFGYHVDDLIVRAADEVHELELGDRMHAGQRRSEGSAYDCRFRNRGIDHTFGAEVIDEPFRDLEGAAVHTNIFPDAKNGWIALHLFPDAFANRLKICNRCHGWYQRKCARSVAAASLVFCTFLTLGRPYKNGILIELSQKTRSPAVSPSGYGDASAISRSVSISLWAASISSLLALSVSHPCSSKYFSSRAIGSRCFQYSK